MLLAGLFTHTQARMRDTHTHANTRMQTCIYTRTHGGTLTSALWRWTLERNGTQQPPSTPSDDNKGVATGSGQRRAARDSPHAQQQQQQQQQVRLWVRRFVVGGDCWCGGRCVCGAGRLGVRGHDMLQKQGGSSKDGSSREAEREARAPLERDAQYTAREERCSVLQYRNMV